MPSDPKTPKQPPAAKVEEDTITRMLVPPTPLQQLAAWRAKAAARLSLSPPAPKKPRRR